jgi:spore coat polysaccharide biosynthesis protein SpsF
MIKKEVIGVVTARMGSTRVPGKSIIPICDTPLIVLVLNLVKKIKNIDKICLATTNLPADDILVDIARSEGILVFRGDPENVLDRIYKCVKRFDADVVVDIGGDCPLLDPVIIEDALNDFLLNATYDYMCNYNPPTFPEGLDVNICSIDALTVAYEKAVAPSQRIHAFSYITTHKKDFHIKNYENNIDLSHHHWSLDFPEDVEFVAKVYEKMRNLNKKISLHSILELIDMDSEVEALDRSLRRSKVSHAFWNSPGIIEDMNNDIIILCEYAKNAILKKEYLLASKFYKEIQYISKELYIGSKR